MLLLKGEDVESILKDLTRDQVLHSLLLFSRTMSEIALPPSDAQVIYQPSRTSVTTSAGNTTLFMPSMNQKNAGVKVVTIPANNNGLTSSLMLLTASGEMEGVLNAKDITGYRTTLASMVLFSRRIWQGKGETVVFGAGKQAEWHARLIMALAKQEIGTVTFVNRQQQRMRMFDRTILSEMRTKYPNTKFNMLTKEENPAYEMMLRDLISTAVAVFCCTSSTTPLFPNAYLESAKVRKKYISLIGSFKPSMYEVDSDTIRSAEILCVDTRKGCLEEAGEIIKAGIPGDKMVELGELISPTSGELNDIVNNNISVLQHGNIVFKSVGMGIMDVVIGSFVLNLAKENGYGLSIGDF